MLINFKEIDSNLWWNFIDTASERVNRLALCAMARTVSIEIKSSRCLEAIEFGEYMADNILNGTENRHRLRLEKLVIAAVKATGDLPADFSSSSSRAWTAPYYLPLRTQSRIVTKQCIDIVVGNTTVRLAHERLKIVLAWQIFNDLYQTRQKKSVRRNVQAIATDIYNSNNFNKDIFILADALQDEMPEEEIMIDHLRSPNPHYKGCWVIDSLRQ